MTTSKRKTIHLYCCTEFWESILCSDLPLGLNELTEAFGNARTVLLKCAMCFPGAEGYLAECASLVLATQIDLLLELRP